jgi:hypothetical protein
VYWYNIKSDLCGRIIDKLISSWNTYGIHATLMVIFEEEGDMLLDHCCYTTPDSFFHELVCIFSVSEPVFVKKLYQNILPSFEFEYGGDQYGLTG